MAQSSLFFWGYEDEKEKLENPIITYFTTVCRCGCAERKNEMGAVQGCINRRVRNALEKAKIGSGRGCKFFTNILLEGLCGIFLRSLYRQNTPLQPDAYHPFDYHYNNIIKYQSNYC